MYSITVWHEALGKYQVVRGRTEAEARMKADLKKAAWNAQYARSLARTHKSQTVADKRAERDALKDEASDRTEEAEQAIAELGQLLTSVVDASPVFEIEKQRLVARFGEPQPKPPRYLDYPRPPKREDSTFAPRFNILDRLFASRRDKKLRLSEEQANDAFRNATAHWTGKVADIKKTNEELQQGHERLTADWTNKKAGWEATQDKANAELDAIVAGLSNGS